MAASTDFLTWFCNCWFCCCGVDTGKETPREAPAVVPAPDKPTNCFFASSPMTATTISKLNTPKTALISQILPVLPQAYWHHEPIRPDGTCRKVLFVRRASAKCQIIQAANNGRTFSTQYYETWILYAGIDLIERRLETRMVARFFYPDSEKYRQKCRHI
jgi:hypothetical protein